MKGKIRPACSITSTATLDTVWIPETAKQGWIIITRDRHIQEHRAEIQVVRVSGARMVVLVGREAVDTFQQLEVLMCQWRKVTGLLPRPGPFIFTATRASFNEVPL